MNLIDGKRGLDNTDEYHKFIGINTGQDTDDAIRHLTNHVNSRSKDSKQMRRNQIISLIRYMDSTNPGDIKPEDIDPRFVYIVNINRHLMYSTKPRSPIRAYKSVK